MIRVTGEARQLIQRLLADEGVAGGGLRITAAALPGEGGGAAFELEMAPRPAPGDVVVETGGVRLFLDPPAADALDAAELVVEQGELALALPAACG
jgi:Fe-S cluster assembly iron-binding protein IscA